MQYVSFFSFPDRYIDEFHKLSKEDLVNRKLIQIPDDSTANVVKTPINNLSVKLTDVLPALLHVDCIEKKALHILNTPESLVQFPSFSEDVVTKFMVAKSAGCFHTVTLKSNDKVACDCKGFKLVTTYCS